MFAVTVSLPIFIWKLSLALFTSKLYLSGFAFILLSLNHCNCVWAAFSNLIRTLRFLNQYNMGCYRSHSLLKGMSWKIKKRSQRNILNNKGEILETHQIKCLSMQCVIQTNSLFSFKVGQE